MRDLDRSLRFYRDLLGMEVVLEQERQGGYLAAIVAYPDAHVRMAHVVFPGDGHRIELFQYLNPEPRGDPGEPRDVGITHVCLVVPDLDAVYRRLGEAGIDFYSPPVDVDAGANAGGRGLYLRDPDGVTLELFQLPPGREGSTTASPGRRGPVKLAGKVCVVTGAAQGIGRAIVEEFVHEGGLAAILDLNGEGAERYASELRGRGIGAVAVECDVADKPSVLAAAERVAAELGPCDVLVNNAGVALMGPSLDFPERDWRRSLDVMATGLFFCCQAFGRQMIEAGGGAIVNISSMNADVAFPMRLAYNAAKAAVKSMTEVLAIEWAEHGVRVNSVAPGVTRTELVDRAIRDGFINEAAYVGRTPMKRLGRPEEIAKAALFLASDDDSSFVTGHFLVVDGGWTAFGYVTD